MPKFFDETSGEELAIWPEWQADRELAAKECLHERKELRRNPLKNGSEQLACNAKIAADLTAIGFLKRVCLLTYQTRSGIKR
jgi:hypothetical protein